MGIELNINDDVQKSQSSAETQFLKANLDEARHKHDKNIITIDTRFHSILFYCLAGILVVATISAGFAIFTISWFYMGPESMQYVKPENIPTIKNIIMSGTLGALMNSAIGGYLRKRESQD